MSTKKQVKFDEQVWEALMNGASKMANAVSATLGPSGNTVMIEQSYGDPKTTKDGVSVAKALELEDPFENLGAKTLRSIASNMSEGDGTTSSIVFSHALLKSARKYITAGYNATGVIKGIESGIKLVIEFIEKHTQPVEGDFNLMAEVATISANGDEEVGKIVRDAFEKVTAKGVITVEESKTGITELEVVEGMELDKGYISPYFVTDKEKGVCELSDPYILVYDGKISTVAPLIELLGEIAKQSEPLLIVADDIDGEALTTLVLNKMQGRLKVAAIKAPSFGDRKKEMMQDIAVLTGAHFITADTGLKLEDINKSFLGKASKVAITKDKTILAGGKGEKADVQTRIKELEGMKERASSDYDREKLEERIGKLSQGVAVIRVGGHSSLEIGELKDRLDDAVHAVKAAIEKGIVPGGGTMFVHAAKMLSESENKIYLDDKAMKSRTGARDQQAGIEILIDALKAITGKIVANTGIEAHASIVEKISENTDVNYGYDARRGEFGNMKKFGVIDATKVLTSVLRNGFSGVRTLISTSVMIADMPSKKDDTHGGGMGPDMY